MLDIERPMLHVGIVPVRLDTANALRRKRQCSCARVIEANIARRYVELVRRVSADDLFVEADQHLLIKYTVTHTHGCCALAKRIPGNSESRRQVSVWSARNLLSKRGNG